VTVSDIDADKVDRFASEHDLLVVDPEHVYDEVCDVFAPCAIGGVLNDDTIDRLVCDIVAGGANNVLESRRHAQALKDRDILYAPDYVINGGGLITVAAEAAGDTMSDALADAREIGPRLLEMVETAEDEDITVLEAADRYAEARLEAGR
ncbi:MAG: leucine dehydrogenase, partial [Halobacteriota archaeon]